METVNSDTNYTCSLVYCYQCYQMWGGGKVECQHAGREGEKHRVYKKVSTGCDIFLISTRHVSLGRMITC
jgi:hypothetical protein